MNYKKQLALTLNRLGLKDKCCRADYATIMISREGDVFTIRLSADKDYNSVRYYVMELKGDEAVLIGYSGLNTDGNYDTQERYYHYVINILQPFVKAGKQC